MEPTKPYIVCAACWETLFGQTLPGGQTLALQSPLTGNQSCAQCGAPSPFADLTEPFEIELRPTFSLPADSIQRDSRQMRQESLPNPLTYYLTAETLEDYKQMVAYPGTIIPVKPAETPWRWVENKESET
jgi:hypothetical protein